MPDTNNRRFYAAGPYPPLQIEAPNLYYARILSQDFAASISEFTAVSQYCYQGWILQTAHPELSHCLFQIARVEMKHLDMLGDLITQLGGDPRYRSYQGESTVVWNTDMLHYARQPRKILRANILAEQTAIQCYLYHIQLIKDPYIPAVLERIIQDEQIHIHIFQSFLATLTKTP